VAKIGRWVAKIGRRVAKIGKRIAKIGRWRKWVAKLGRWVAEVGRWLAKVGRWVAKFVARQLTTAALWVRIQTSLKKTKKGDISKGVGKRLARPKNI
jgi:hypothetical protein